MPSTISNARDETYGKLKTAADALHPELVLIFDALLDQPKPPAAPTPWARVKMRHNDGLQASLTNDTGKKRWKRIGILVIQLFTALGKGLVSNDDLVSMILNAYEGKSTPGGVWFKKCRFQEVGNSGDFFQTNIFVDFEYDEIK